ncbi:MAG: beta-ketoacyl-[acyl-carrier-protein] synthase family protein [Desulfobacteraceae bacterium]|nr:beta-ketoacyl-[acyl-carrier-protein] synthase family protein [Desulfobacteraceae bacterium]
MISNEFNPVVVTGIGVVSAIGNCVTEFETALFNGKCGISPVTLFDVSEFACQLAGQVQCSDLSTGFLPSELKRVSRCDLLGMNAARQALQDAGLHDFSPRYDRGIVLGGGAGGMLSWENYRRAKWQGLRAGPGKLLNSSPCTLTDILAAKYGFCGYRSTVTTACSSSSTSIGAAYDLIRSGELSMALTGGAESLCEVTFAGFNSLRVMSPEPCRPFDKDRKGLCLGEGAAVLVLENYTHAVQRRARIYAHVCGYGFNSDAYHMTAPHPEAKGMSRVIRLALENAGLMPDQIDYVNAHGTATTVNDPLETKAIKDALGHEHARRLVISSTKSMIGHCLGAAGALEAAAAVLAVYRQKAPPTAGLKQADPECDLDYAPQRAKPMGIRYALSNSFAFGGNNACVVFRHAT